MLILTRAEGESLYLDNIYDADGNQLPPIEVTNMGKIALAYMLLAQSLSYVRKSITEPK
ncbi:hypothetical protein L1D29_15300 [Shewanella insulae]|uniref:hypothetical protein n=1 Tax=Shewanella insulae TaxID=2681496 RepID=UPI001EFD9492|nr:hypothetical protein [Shewanella insulae]MCG9714186.1 hypothetical protein [Shewanella insulae]